MRLTRCYLPGQWQSGAIGQLPAAQADHLVRVLRLRPGNPVTIFDGEGRQWSATLLASERGRHQIEIGAQLPDEAPPAVAITLLQSLARGEKMDWIVQKATELGVGRIQPLITEHSIVRLDDRQAESKLNHWRAVAAAACEQCGRSRLPVVSPPVDLADLRRPQDDHAPLLLLDPDANRSLTAVARELAAMQPPVAAVSFAIGPEGGLSELDTRRLSALGAQGVRLGPRILRTETAAIAVLSILQGMLGDCRDR